MIMHIFKNQNESDRREAYLDLWKKLLQAIAEQRITENIE